MLSGMARISWLFVMAALLLFMGLFSGCSEPAPLYDCQRVCDKYAECFDGQVDRGRCVLYCEDRGASQYENFEFPYKVSACENCMERSQCSTRTIECFSKCSGVVATSFDTSNETALE